MTREERHIAVLNRMLESMDVYDSIQPTTERKKAIKAAIQALSQEPCTEKSGKWKSTIDGKPICSECGFVSESEDGYFVSHYCPNCGAKMESEDKE